MMMNERHLSSTLWNLSCCFVEGHILLQRTIFCFLNCLKHFQCWRDTGIWNGNQPLLCCWERRNNIAMWFESCLNLPSRGLTSNPRVVQQLIVYARPQFRKEQLRLQVEQRTQYWMAGEKWLFNNIRTKWGMQCCQKICLCFLQFSDFFQAGESANISIHPASWKCLLTASPPLLCSEKSYHSFEK